MHALIDRSSVCHRNLEGLAPYFRLLAFDWLGTGMSGRPPFKADGREAAEAFFVESLNLWRAKMGLEKFILMGHSLGGYLSACYALKYPQHVSHLILVCPAGVPEAPPEVSDRIKVFVHPPLKMIIDATKTSSLSRPC